MPEYEVGEAGMEKIVVVYDKEANTLDVWFGEPATEAVCQRVEDEIVLKKDRDGTVIGFEKLNYLPAEVAGEKVAVEVLTS